MNGGRITEFAYLLMRVVIGLLFFQHGGQKLLGWFGGIPAEFQGALTTTAGILEFFGGLAIMLGLFTRPVAFLLSGMMAVAYFMAHQKNGFWPIENGGEPAVLYCFIFLFLAARGAGEFSLDGLIKGRRGPASATGRQRLAGS